MFASVVVASNSANAQLAGGRLEHGRVDPIRLGFLLRCQFGTGGFRSTSGHRTAPAGKDF
jgi:hypothetical protein